MKRPKKVVEAAKRRRINLQRRDVKAAQIKNPRYGCQRRKFSWRSGKKNSSLIA
jgi:hypothetical protein